MFRKFLWAGGLNFSCHPAQASSIIRYGKLISSVTKPTEQVIDIEWSVQKQFQPQWIIVQLSLSSCKKENYSSRVNSYTFITKTVELSRGKFSQ